MLKFATIYGDNMVFQQQMPMTVWGYGDDGDEIKVSITSDNGECVSEGVSTVKDGRWSVELSPLEVMKNLSLTAEGAGGVVRLTNVAVGEVWFCSGQSNAECNFNYCSGTEEYIDEVGKFDFRFMDIEPAISFEERENGENVRWIIPDKSNMMELGVVPVLFGHCLSRDLRDVPVAVVRNYRSGNCLFTYISDEIMRSRPEYSYMIDIFNDEKCETKSAWSMIPVAFYNAMTVPVKAFRFRGALWYQGESDAAFDRPKIYKQLLTDTIDMWRGMFRSPDMPVLMVMLCPFEQPPFDFKTVRQIQYEMAKEDENIHLISTADLGPTGDEDESPIHPKFKTPISERAALAALGTVYKTESSEWCAPVLDTAVLEGKNIVMKFSHAGSGLVSTDEKLKGFDYTADGVYYHAADAEIVSPDTVIIKDASDARMVRYCCINLSEDKKTLGGTLTNDTGIPAIPFAEFI